MEIQGPCDMIQATTLDSTRIIFMELLWTIHCPMVRRRILSKDTEGFESIAILNSTAKT